MRTSTARPSAGVETDTLYWRSSRRVTAFTWIPAASTNVTSGVVACAEGRTNATSASTTTAIVTPERAPQPDVCTVLLSPCLRPSPAFVHRLDPSRGDVLAFAQEVGRERLRRGH